MDIYKTGKFIAEKRKEQGLTQKALAEKVGVTDKAISKWERGLSYPDISVRILQDIPEYLSSYVIPPLCTSQGFYIDLLLSFCSLEITSSVRHSPTPVPALQSILLQHPHSYVRHNLYMLSGHV